MKPFTLTWNMSGQPLYFMVDTFRFYEGKESLGHGTYSKKVNFYNQFPEKPMSKALRAFCSVLGINKDFVTYRTSYFIFVNNLGSNYGFPKWN